MLFSAPLRLCGLSFHRTGAKTLRLDFDDLFNDDAVSQSYPHKIHPGRHIADVKFQMISYLISIIFLTTTLSAHKRR
jgi:hypothetical protein